MTPFEYIEQFRDVPFSWGTHDCGTFVDGWYRELHGKPLFTERWSSEAEAEAIIAEYGSINKVVTHYLGRSVPILQARIGDIVIATNGSLGISLGNRCASPSPDGLALNPLKYYRRGWRV